MIIKVPFIRTEHNYDRDIVSVETGLCCKDESLAIQSAADECDINTIVRRFGLTGELPGDFAMPQSGDFTNVPDYHTAMNLIVTAQNEFLKVPAEIRARFSNDPQAFMEFCESPSNKDEIERLGLAKPKVVPPDPVVVRVVPDNPV
nr:MAG: internal scaffolding protein [Microvirus sp.]